VRSAFFSILRRALACSALAAAAAFSPAAGAAIFQNLYVVQVPTDPAAADQRAAATRAAMQRLLVRVTGNRDAGLDPQLAPLIAEAPRYLNSYGLLRQGQAQVGFNGSQVEQALSSLGRPVWGAERPLTLVWIALDDGVGGRALLGANDAQPDLAPALVETLAAARTELAAVADERGLPLTLPLLDLEDMNAVTFADVWGGFDDRVLQASLRYRADAVLIGRIHPGVAGNEVQWLLLKDGARTPIDGVALRDGLDAVANQSAAELSVVGGATSTRLTVQDVVTLADYGRVLSYLEKLSVLQAVDVESFERGSLALKVVARGDARVLERVLALGSVLAPSGGTSAADGTLAFRVARGGAGR
jgi:hypothetical protein